MHENKQIGFCFECALNLVIDDCFYCCPMTLTDLPNSHLKHHELMNKIIKTMIETVEKTTITNLYNGGSVITADNRSVTTWEKSE